MQVSRRPRVVYETPAGPPTPGQVLRAGQGPDGALQVRVGGAIVPGEVLPLAYGQGRLQAKLLWYRFDGGGGQFFLAACAGPIEEFTTLLVKGQPVPSSWIRSTHLGETPQAVGVTTGIELGLPLDPLTRYPLLAYELLTVPSDNTLEFDASKDLSWDGKWLQVYDPRTSTTAWSRNAALIILDVLQNLVDGGRIPASAIDLQSFEDAADLCDEVVSGAPRWTIDIAITQKTALKAVLDALRFVCAAEVYRLNGKIRIDIDAPADGDPEIAFDTAINCREFRRHWEEDQAAPTKVVVKFHNATLATADKGESLQDGVEDGTVPLRLAEYTSDALSTKAQAQRVASYTRKVMQPIRASLICSPVGSLLRKYQKVSVVSEEDAEPLNEWRVIDFEPLENGEYQVDLRIEDEDIYEPDEAGEQTGGGGSSGLGVPPIVQPSCTVETYGPNNKRWIVSWFPARNYKPAAEFAPSLWSGSNAALDTDLINDSDRAVEAANFSALADSTIALLLGSGSGASDDVFVDLSQTSRFWGPMAASTTANDVFVVVYSLDYPGAAVYRRTAGAGAFSAIPNSTSMGWGSLSISGAFLWIGSAYYSAMVKYDIAAGTGGVDSSFPSRPWNSSAAAPNGNLYFTATGSGQITFRDAGTTAITAIGPTKNWTAIAIDQASGDVYAYADTEGIYVQIGGVGSFTSVGTVSPQSGVKQMAVAANGDLYIAFIGGVWKSTDGGVNWTVVDADPRSGICIAADGKVYAGEAPGSIYATGVTGVTAAAKTLGAARFDRTDGGTTLPDWVYEGTTDGSTWFPLGQPFTRRNDVLNLAPSSAFLAEWTLAGIVGWRVRKGSTAAGPEEIGEIQVYELEALYAYSDHVDIVRASDGVVLTSVPASLVTEVLKDCTPYVQTSVDGLTETLDVILYNATGKGNRSIGVRLTHSEPVITSETVYGENKEGTDAEAGQVVAIHSSGTGFVLADSGDVTKAARGMWLAATADGESGHVATAGPVTLADWTAVAGSTLLTPGANYFRGPAGTLVDTPLTPPCEHQHLGQAHGTNTLILVISASVTRY